MRMILLMNGKVVSFLERQYNIFSTLITWSAIHGSNDPSSKRVSDNRGKGLMGRENSID